MSSSDCCPFILRFSRSMLRPNPKKIKGGIPRFSGTARPSISSVSDNLYHGFSYYHKYQYNTSFPVFCRMSMKPDSVSKSLRYPFLKYTGLKLMSGLSLNDFVFSLSDESEICKLTSKISRTVNPAVIASFSHISEISSYMPEDKLSLSSDFLHYAGQNRRIQINIFLNDDTGAFTSFLKNELGATDITVNTTLGNSVKASIPDIRAKLDHLFNHSIVRSVSTEDVLTLSPHYLRREELPLDCVSPRDFGRKYPKAAVADSGLSDTSLLKEWEIDTVVMTDDRDSKHSHGTFVTGRLLKDGEKFGGIMFLNIEILPSAGSISIDLFYDKMRNVLKKYHNLIKIYNLSIGSDTCARISEYSAAAHALDMLQYEFDVLFIISAGNYDDLRINGEPMFGEDRITSPAESVNSLTVGSVAHIDTNIQIKNSPSLFTRRGPGTGHTIKPDLCAYGGAHETRMGKLRPVGVFSIGTRNELAEDTGTSHAVPRVTALASKIYDRYSHAFKSPDMTRALILHYTHLNSGTTPSIYTGYGILHENQTDFDSLENSAVYLNSGYVKSGSIVEIPEIPVPAILFESGCATCRICVTLVYKPETDINFPNHYTCINLELSMGYYIAEEWKSLITAKDILTYKGDQPTQMETKEMQKWHPVKMYEKSIKKKALPDKLTIRLTPAKRDFYDKKAQTEYSMVISFSHESKNVFESMQNEYENYNGLLEPASSMWKTC